MNLCHLSFLISKDNAPVQVGRWDRAKRGSMGKESQTEGENWQSLSWTQASDHIQKIWGDCFEQGDLHVTGPLVIGMDNDWHTFNAQGFRQGGLLIYLVLYSMPSWRGLFPVSGTKEEKHKATTQERQQKKMGSCVLIWLKMARAVMAPPVQARHTIPRPVDLEVELRTGLDDFVCSDAGYSERETLPKTTYSEFHPIPAQCVRPWRIQFFIYLREVVISPGLLLGYCE